MSPKALEIARNYAKYWNRQEPDLPVLPTDVAGLSRIFREGSLDDIKDHFAFDRDYTMIDVLELLQGNGVYCRPMEDGNFVFLRD
jgi:hypothetical protein